MTREHAVKVCNLLFEIEALESLEDEIEAVLDRSSTRVAAILQIDIDKVFEKTRKGLLLELDSL